MPATKTKTNAAKLAPRLVSLEGVRLGLYLARPGGSSKQTERSVYKLLARLLGEVPWPYGYGELKGETFRIGHMGDLTLEDVDTLLRTADEVLGA